MDVKESVFGFVLFCSFFFLFFCFVVSSNLVFFLLVSDSIYAGLGLCLQ